MKNPLDLLQYRKSYQSGLLMAKAFRILKKHTNQALSKHGINATDWGILGVLHDSKKGLRLSDIAYEIGVKAPYVTNSVSNLVKKKLVQVAADSTDTRARVATLTPTGVAFVTSTESEIIAHMRTVFAGVGKRDALGYLTTLVALVKNHQAELDDSTDLDHLAD